MAILLRAWAVVGAPAYQIRLAEQQPFMPQAAAAVVMAVLQAQADRLAPVVLVAIPLLGAMPIQPIQVAAAVAAAE